MDKIFFKDSNGADISVQIRPDGSAVVRAGSGKCSQRKKYRSYNAALRAVSHLLGDRSGSLFEALQGV